MSSTHEALVVPVKLEKHPNADALSIVNVWGFSCVVRTDEWKDEDKGIYIIPDTMVNLSLPQFVFLDKERIKVRKFRGVISQGLLIHAPKEAQIGEDYYERLGLKHYEPEINLSTSGDNVPTPEGVYLPYFDIENARKYNTLFEGEVIQLTGKVDGSNCLYTLINNEVYIRSRTQWKKESEVSIYWKAFRENPLLEEFCRIYPDYAIWGEVYGGKIQGGGYGLARDQVKFIAFDVYDKVNRVFLDAGKAREISEKFTEWVQVIKVGNFDFEELKVLVEQDDPLAAKNGVKQLMEGIVVRPLVEGYDPTIGRRILKIISNRHYEGK